jgi:ATP-dependent Clp protease ATP-binding subunit ClpC
MQLASKEAQLFNHEYVGTEHLLLGLIKEDSGVAANVLRILGMNYEDTREAIVELVQVGPEWMSLISGWMPHTPRLKNVIENASLVASELKHEYVGTEHLLISLLRDGEGIAADVFKKFDLSPKTIEDEVMSLLGFREIDERPEGFYRDKVIEIKMIMKEAEKGKTNPWELLGFVSAILKDVN